MKKPLRVLMVEDSEDDALLTIHALKKGGYDPVYERVEDAGAMRKALETGSWDIILCDYQMPKFSGLAAIALLKETGVDLPFIIVSGAIGEEMAVECMRSGAYDYVMKNSLSRLASAIDRELKEVESRRKHRRVEETLKKSQRLLAETGRIGKVGGWEFDIDTGKQTWTEEVYNIHEVDLTYDPTVEKGIHFYTPASMPIIERAVQRVIEHGEPYNVELEIITAKGNLRSVNAIGKADLEHRRIYGFFQDITERRRAEDDLKEALEKYRSLAAYVDSIYLVDRNCTFLFMNEKHLKRFGLLLEEVVGKKYGEFHSEEDAKRLAADVNEVCQTGNPITKEHRSERDGKFFLRTFTPIIGKDSDGKISQVAVISKEITHIKLAENKLQDTLNSLRRAVNTTIQVMVSAVETRDPYTAGHQIRSADLARAIATEMGLSPEKIDGLRMAGSIHDIGKLSIPAEILSKPTKLSEIEFSLIKEHAQRGYEMLKDVESPWPLAEIVYQHHERMDGSGYPRSLKGEEILIEARILTVADVVEAMASHRPYRPGLGIAAALNEIEQNSGTLYDNAVADACLRLFREKGFKLEGT
jgi:PAS domain S-box-containing protein